MLVLSRKTEESIHIDGAIRIKVIAIHGNSVQLGIEAPASVGIYREEILLKVDPRALIGPSWGQVVATGETHDEAIRRTSTEGRTTGRPRPAGLPEAADVQPKVAAYREAGRPHRISNRT